MENNNIKIFLSVIGLLILGLIATVILQSRSTTTSSAPGKYDAFATCLKDQGAIFYGAFWCPHCQAEEKNLGMTRQQLEAMNLYVECSTLDAKGQTQICIDKKITSYPTWILKDGTRVPDDATDGSGVKLSTLATATGCMLPE